MAATSEEVIKINEHVNSKYQIAICYQVKVLIKSGLYKIPMNKFLYKEISRTISVDETHFGPYNIELTILIIASDLDKLKNLDEIVSCNIEKKFNVFYVELRAQNAFKTNIEGKAKTLDAIIQDYLPFSLIPPKPLQYFGTFNFHYYIPEHQISVFENMINIFGLFFIVPKRIRITIAHSKELESLLRFLECLDKRIETGMVNDRKGKIISGFALVSIDIAFPFYVSLASQLITSAQDEFLTDDPELEEKARNAVQFSRALNIEKNENKAIDQLIPDLVNPNDCAFPGLLDHPICTASKNGMPRLLKTLLQPEFKIDINTTTDDGATPLFIAAMQGHSEIVELLLKHGANPEISQRIKLSDIKKFGSEFSVTQMRAMEKFIAISRIVTHQTGELQEVTISPLQIACVMCHTNVIVKFMPRNKNYSPVQVQAIIKLIEYIESNTLPEPTKDSPNFFSFNPDLKLLEMAKTVLFLFLCFESVAHEYVPAEAKQGQLGDILSHIFAENPNTKSFSNSEDSSHINKI